jgi:hypothetical protein
VNYYLNGMTLAAAAPFPDEYDHTSNVRPALLLICQFNSVRSLLLFQVLSEVPIFVNFQD